MKQLSNKTAEDIFLEYVNDWLTIEKMADHYQVEYDWLEAKVDDGMRINNKITIIS